MKKILILTSIGGGGQVTVDKALTQSLKDEYNLKSVLYFSKILNCVDPIALMTLGKYSGEDFYNYVQKKRYYRFMQLCYYLSRWYYHLFSGYLIKKTIEYLKQEKPDLVISIIPIVNDILAKSCQELDIPLLIIPVDMEAAFYTRGLKEPYSKKLFVALPFDHSVSRQSMASANIPNHQVFTIQYPLRHDFYESKNIACIKKEYGIVDNHPIVLILMGSQGNHASYTFARELKKLQAPAHLFICIGKNEKIKKELESLVFPPHITPHIIGYTDRVSDLMAIADIMVSKTGALSVIEGLYSDTPIIADQTEFVLSWELFHQDFLEKYDCGFILKKLDNLTPIVSDLLHDQRLLAEVKNNITKILAAQKGESINAVVKKIIG